MTFDLLPPEEWPEGWTNPPELEWFLEREIIDLEPWITCYGTVLVELHRQIAVKYPNRSLVPIVRRGDNDDTACWEVGGRGIVIIHLGADPGREERGRFDDVWGFLRAVFAEFIERAQDETRLLRIDRGLPPLG